MRFLIIVKATQTSEADARFDEYLIAQMARYHEELARAGVLLDASGLKPSSAGWRIRFDADRRTVVQGPFERDANLMAGYTLIQARSPEEALEWARRFPNPRSDGLAAEIELRQLHGPEDSPPPDAARRFDHWFR